jgi:hypothetical protein
MEWSMKKEIKQNNKSVSKKTHKKRRLLIIFVVVLLAWLAFDISGFGGNIRFYSKWIECGGKPVVTNPDPDFGGGSIQDYSTAPTFSLVRLSPIYFCTPLQAEEAGYSANSQQYTFPHLKVKTDNAQ